MFLVTTCLIRLQFLVDFMQNMDVFSLEEDDYGDMFITQSSNNTSEVESSGNNLEILGDGSDFSSLCVCWSVM